eukprot:TRINITY_DN75715_c0_g1_i1.p1 TRINITY_DN75715_c0_g1~~TRINITY_DN75715_c0_g1_i1.p1  ORF type:complete len:438 (+),score=77.39 TRINITY_DN75715_c0_g1_i1:54-1367(+)
MMAKTWRTACRLSPQWRHYASMRNDEVHDVVVVGGGVMGVWAAIMAARRGACVALAEQFEPDHHQGSSHGDGRIYRLAYAEDVYYDMMMHSLPLWHDLQASTADKVIAKTGQLNIAPEGHERLDALEQLYKRRQVTYERLSASALKERFPQYSLASDKEALYQPDGGVLFASSSIRAAWQLAKALGVKTVTGFRAASVREEAKHSVVVSEKGTSLYGKGVVLAPGAWTSKMAAQMFGLDITTRISAEEVCYYAPKDTNIDHSFRSMPNFSASVDNGLGPQGYYGLPMIDVPGIKASAHYCGPTVDPDARPASVGGISGVRSAEEEASAQARKEAVIQSTNRFVRETFPNVEHVPFQTQSCLYTATPDHHYVIGKVPGLLRVVLAGGGSGHAFKMGPAIGDCCAALALGQASPLSLERFAVEREALRLSYKEEEARRH